MSRAYTDLMFTPAVRQAQARQGSRVVYAPLDETEERRDRLSGFETEFIEARDNFYMATVGASGWPYVQHRGGPRGFLKVLDDRTLGFADFRGNRQYISVGNLAGNDRVSLLLMDYPNRQRLKLIGRVRVVEEYDDPSLMERLHTVGYLARIERALLIDVEGYDWNCPQHITPRWTEEEARERLRVQAHVDQPALGNGPLQVVIAGVRQLTPRVRSYELAAIDGGDLPAIDAGAHLDLPVRLRSGVVSSRRYSIASDPRRRDRYEIAVLRHDDGTGGSLAIHESYTVGTRLNCELPGNDFELARDPLPAILIAGGIGITPIRAMAQVLRSGGHSFIVHYAYRSAGEAAFLAELRERLGDRLHCHDGAHGDRLDVRRIVDEAPVGAQLYVCGPARMIDAVVAAARARCWAPNRVHFERFGAATRGAEQAIQVKLRRSGTTLAVAADVSVLDALEHAGIEVPSGCRQGRCGSCALEVLDGQPDHRDSALTDTQKREQRLMCVCVSRAYSQHLTLDL